MGSVCIYVDVCYDIGKNVYKYSKAYVAIPNLKCGYGVTRQNGLDYLAPMAFLLC